MTTPAIYDALTRLQAGKDAHVRAATGLLIEQDFWLRRADFLRMCVHVHETGTAWIKWSAVRDALRDNKFLGSTSEIAVLRFAASLALDEFRFCALGASNRDSITRAISVALGHAQIAEVTR